MKTEAAEAGKLIRRELKDKFPEVKFKVTSENFAGGDAVNVEWTDGVTEDQVKDLLNKYQEGHFDGMRDIYEYSNDRKDIPQAKFTMAKRNLSDEISVKAARVAKDNFWDLKDAPDPEDDLGKDFYAFDNYVNWAQMARRMLDDVDLRGAKDVKISTDNGVYQGLKPIKEE